MSGSAPSKTSERKHRQQAGVYAPKPTRHTFSPGLHNELVALQSIIGNRAVNELLGSLPKPDLDEGQMLDADARREMEKHFGFDFSKVRIHAGPKAEEKTRTIDASALTEGTDIYFGLDQYQPLTDRGQRILTHELAHVIQQQPGNDGERRKSVSELETQAKSAERILFGHTEPAEAVTPGSASPGTAQKVTADEELRRRRERLSLDVGPEVQQNIEERGIPLETIGEENIPIEPTRSPQGVSKDAYEEFAKRPDKRETFEEFLKRGGVARKIPPGVSGNIYKKYLERSNKSETLEEYIEGDKKVKKKTKENLRAKRKDRIYRTNEGRKAEMDKLFADEEIKGVEDPTPLGIKIRLWKEQGRQERQGALRRRAFDPTVNPEEEDRRYLAEQLKKFYPEMERGTYDEDIHGLRNPPGKDMAHFEEKKETARAGYDMEHTIFKPTEENRAEEAERKRKDKTSKGTPAKKKIAVAKPPVLRKTVVPEENASALPVLNSAPTTGFEVPSQGGNSKFGTPTGTVRKNNLNNQLQTPDPRQKEKQQSSDSSPARMVGINPLTSLRFGPGRIGAGQDNIRESGMKLGNRGSVGVKQGTGWRVDTRIQELPDSRYQVTLTIEITGQAGLSGSAIGNRAGGGVGATASGSLALYFTHVFSEEKKQEYLGAVAEGKKGVYQELNILDLLVRGSLDERRKFLAGFEASLGSAEAAKNMAEGDSVTFSKTGQVGGGLEVTRRGLGAEFGTMGHANRSVTIARRGGNIELTIANLSGRTDTGGGSGAYGLGGASFRGYQGQTNDQSVSFTLDPTKYDFSLNWNRIAAVSTFSDLQRLAVSSPELGGVSTSGEGTAKGHEFTPSIGGVGMQLGSGTSFYQQKIIAPEGDTNVFGGGTQSALICHLVIVE